MNVVPTDLFHGPVRIARPIRRRGAEAGVVVGHHRLVLGLGDLVLAEVKALGQGDLGLVLIRAPARFAGRTAHRKSPRLHPDHFQVGCGVGDISGLVGFEGIPEEDGEVALYGGVVLVLCLHPDGISRGVGLVIKTTAVDRLPLASRVKRELLSSPTPLTK